MITKSLFNIFTAHFMNTKYKTIIEFPKMLDVTVIRLLLPQSQILRISWHIPVIYWAGFRFIVSAGDILRQLMRYLSVSVLHLVFGSKWEIVNYQPHQQYISIFLRKEEEWTVGCFIFAHIKHIILVSWPNCLLDMMRILERK